MKKIFILFAVSLCLYVNSFSQYATATFGLYENEDYIHVARKYLVNTVAANNDETNYHISLFKIGNEIETKASDNTTYPWVNSNFTSAQSIDLFGGKFEMYKFGYAQRIDKISPLNSVQLAFLNLDVNRDLVPHLIVIRPKDDIQRPCILVTHGAEACSNALDPFKTKYMDFLGIADLLMRGYCVVFYEIAATCRFQGNLLIKNHLESTYKIYENTGVASSSYQRVYYIQFLLANAAARFTSGLSAKLNILPLMYTYGHSLGGITSLSLALADENINYNHAIFQYLTNNNPGFNFFSLPAYQSSPYYIIGTTGLACALPDPTTNDNKMGNFFDNSDKYVGVTMMSGRNDIEFKPDYTTRALPDLNYEGPFKLKDRITANGMNSALFVNCYSDHLFYARPAGFDPNSSPNFTTLKNAIMNNANFPTGASAADLTVWNGYTKFHQQQYEFNTYTGLIYQIYLNYIYLICINPATGMVTPCPITANITEWVRPKACTSYTTTCPSAPSDSWELVSCSNPATGNRQAFEDIEETIRQVHVFQEANHIISSKPDLPFKMEKTAITSGIKVFPNPAKNELAIESSPVAEMNIQVTDLTGRLLINKTFYNTTGMINLNISDFPPALYVLKMRAGDQLFVNKFVKN